MERSEIHLEVHFPNKQMLLGERVLWSSKFRENCVKRVTQVSVRRTQQSRDSIRRFGGFGFFCLFFVMEHFEILKSSYF